MTEQENDLQVDAESLDTKGDSISESVEVSADAVNLNQAGASTVNTEIVQISQGGAGQVIATEVDVNQSGVNRIQAENAKFSESAAVFIQAGSVDLTDSAAGAIRTQNLSIRDGAAGVICSQAVNMEEGSAAGIMVASQVAGETIKTKLLLSGHVEGNVETVLDTNQVLFAGIAAGAVISLFLFIGQLISRRC